MNDKLNINICGTDVSHLILSLSDSILSATRLVSRASSTALFRSILTYLCNRQTFITTSVTNTFCIQNFTSPQTEKCFEIVFQSIIIRTRTSQDMFDLERFYWREGKKAGGPEKRGSVLRRN